MPRGYLREKDYRLIDIENYIRRLMKESGMTQICLANKMGISQPVFSKKLKTLSFTVEELLIIFKETHADPDRVGKMMVIV